MKMLIRFAPFVALSLVSSATDWRWGVAAGLVTLVVVTLAMPPRRLGILGAAMLTYFLVMGALALWWPDGPIGDVLHPLAAAWLAIVAGASALVGHPFTLDFARPMVGPEVAASPEFLAINRRITLVWAAAFAVVAVAGVTAVILDRNVLGTLATVGALVWAAKRTSAATGSAAGASPSGPTATATS